MWYVDVKKRRDHRATCFVLKYGLINGIPYKQAYYDQTNKILIKRHYTLHNDPIRLRVDGSV